MKLRSTENKLVGRWIYANNRMLKDETCDRIEWLVNTYLRKVAVDASGWDVLYKDPEDNRLWELTYAQSEMHEGGPPTLTHISIEEAKLKYAI